MTKSPEIGIARAYDDLTETPGARLLVDRIWPRGIAKADLALATIYPQPHDIALDVILTDAGEQLIREAK